MDRSGKCHAPCAYPHGGLCTLMYVLSTITAYGLSFYAISSCSFVVITFKSRNGNFGQLFANRIDMGTDLSEETTGAGLFSWLEPLDMDKWDKGQCSGYTLLAREVIADNTFEAVRVMGILIVILGGAITIWAFVLSCLQLNKLQLWLVRIITFALFVSMNLLHLVKRSALCHKVGESTECKLGQGGIVSIAAGIMWFVAFIISVVYFRTIAPGDMPKQMTKEEQNERLEKMARKIQRHEERRRRRQLAEEYAARLQLELVYQGSLHERFKEHENMDVEQQGGSFTDDDTVEDPCENVTLAIGQFDASINEQNTEIIHHFTTEEEMVRNQVEPEPGSHAQDSMLRSDTYNEGAQSDSYLHQNPRAPSPTRHIQNDDIVFRNTFQETRSPSPTLTKQAVALRKSSSLGVRSEIVSSTPKNIERSRSMGLTGSPIYEGRPSTPTNQVISSGRRTPSSPVSRRTPSPSEAATVKSGNTPRTVSVIPFNTNQETRSRSRSRGRTSISSPHLNHSNRRDQSNSSDREPSLSKKIKEKAMDERRARSQSRGRRRSPSKKIKEKAMEERSARSQSRGSRRSPSKSARSQSRGSRRSASKTTQERRARSKSRGEINAPHTHLANMGDIVPFRTASPEKPPRSRSSSYHTGTPHTYQMQNKITSRNRSSVEGNPYSLTSQGIMTKNDRQETINRIPTEEENNESSTISQLYTDEGEVLHTDSFSEFNPYSTTSQENTKTSRSIENRNLYHTIPNQQDEVTPHDLSGQYDQYDQYDARHDDEYIVEETDGTSVMTPEIDDVEAYNTYVQSRLRSIDELIDRRDSGPYEL